MQSLPLHILITTSNNTTLSLNLSEIIDTSIITNITHANTKKTRSKFDNNERPSANDYNIGDLVIITKNKQGLIRYIGQLNGDGNVWFGIELIGGHKGFHNGSFQGQQYFTCGENQGIFVKKHELTRKMIMKDITNNITTKTKPKPPKINKKKLNRHRKRSSLNDIHKIAKAKNIMRKPGPRDIGRIPASDWTPIPNADKIIEKHMSSTKSSVRSRPRSARCSATFRSKSTARPRGSRPTSAKRSARRRSNTSTITNNIHDRLDKNATLIPMVVDTSRSQTPSPSRFGLIIHENKDDDVVIRQSDDTDTMNVNEEVKMRKNVRNRSRSQHHPFRSKSQRTVGFPDISRLMSSELRNVRRKRQRRQYEHMLSNSTSNVMSGLNMSETYHEDAMFAEVNAEIDGMTQELKLLEKENLQLKQ